MTKAEVRFWSKVSFPPGGHGCWLFHGSDKGNGYGEFWSSGKKVLAHRFAYSICVGDIPVGLELDHVKARGCSNRNCVNPSHLEPVTRQENTKRGRAGSSGAAFHRAKTVCPSGHPYDENNTYVNYKGHRSCRICRKACIARGAAK